MAISNSHNLQQRVLKMFHSLLFYSPEDQRAKEAEILKMSNDGLLEFMKILESAHNEQDKILKILCEHDENFSKGVHDIFGSYNAKKGAKKKLKKLKTEIKTKSIHDEKA